MNKLEIKLGKTLKLTNALIRHISDEEFQVLNSIVLQMENYLRSKGASTIGPLIQCSQTVVNASEEVDIKMQYICQSNLFIANTEFPYKMESVLRINKCLFVRFVGKQQDISYAYDKLNLYAYEENIQLTGRTFTVFTSKSDDDFSADIFMETKQL